MIAISIIVAMLAVQVSAVTTPNCPLSDLVNSLKDADKQFKFLKENDYLECSENDKAAIQRLEELIRTADYRNNLCSIETVNKFGEFYNEFLHPNEKGKTKVIRKELRDFAVAYGLKMSLECRKSMAKQLTGRNVRGLLSLTDFDMFSQWIQDDSAVAETIGPTSHADDIFLPQDVCGTDVSDKATQWLTRSPKARDALQQIKDTCTNRFEPIYDKLFMPLAKLATMGFEYRNSEHDKFVENAEDKIELWPRIAFFCELLKTIEIKLVKQKKDSDEAEVSGLSGGASQDSEDGFKEGGGEAYVVAEFSDDASKDLAKYFRENYDVQQPIVYHPEPVTLENLLFDRQDKAFLKAVKQFKESRDEKKVRKVRWRKNFSGVLAKHAKKFRIDKMIDVALEKLARRAERKLNLRDDNEEVLHSLQKYLVPEEKGPKRKMLIFNRMLLRGGTSVLAMTAALSAIAAIFLV